MRRSAEFMRRSMERALTGLAAPAALLGCLLFAPRAAMAIQAHGGPEGLYIHQAAHILFMFSMGALIYWLKESGLIEEPGWRCVQYSAFFFILWNVDAVIGHYLDGRGDLFRLADEGTWKARIYLAQGSGKVLLLYYCTKLDHLFCVPGIFFLHRGLRRLLKQV